ncbi:hypothetical protein B0H11DRAFT_2036909 [Mycena galericulata]|nr:hypothetical protein B0H11DRAFT_2036909 [Mycena galericulata]
MSLHKIGQDQWTQTAVKSTFRIDIPDNLASASTNPTSLCGLGWRFWCSIEAESTPVFIDAQGVMVPGRRIILYFNPHLVQSAAYGELSFSIQTENLFALNDTPFYPTLNLPHNGYPEDLTLGTYGFSRSNHTTPIIAITVTLPSNLGLSIPRSLEPRMETAFADMIGGEQAADIKFYAYTRVGSSYVTHPRPMFGKVSLLRGFSPDLDDLISGAEGFHESKVVDMDDYVIDESRFGDYDYMSDSDLDADDDDESGGRLSPKYWTPVFRAVDSTFETHSSLKRSELLTPEGKRMEFTTASSSPRPLSPLYNSPKKSKLTPAGQMVPLPPSSESPHIFFPITPVRHGMGRVIVVKDTACRTWNALLYYLYTKKITFYNRNLPEEPRRKLDCSAKSMYRLTEKLGLEELKALAFEAVRSQMSVENIVQEAFSKFTSLYPDIQRIEVEFLIAHLSEVKKDIQSELKSICGARPECAEVLTEIVCRDTIPNPGTKRGKKRG